MTKLDDIKVGDEVAVSVGGTPKDWWTTATAEKVTKTQITAGGERYNLRTGIRIGEGLGYWQSRLAPMSPMHRELIAETQREKLQQRLAAVLGRGKFALDRLRRIEAILKEGQG